MYDSVVIEERNKPTVSLVNNGFAKDAESASRGKGMPVLRCIPTSVPCEASIIEEIEAGVVDAMDSIVEALTRSLSEEEKSPKPAEIEKPARIIFKGSLLEINRFYYQRGWTDGLPITPPTEEAVEEMLTGTDLAPDHLLGKLESRLGKATIEKVAINAVMAGALPTHMPVLIAGTRLLLESEPGWMGFTTFGFSTGSWAPFWIINGPVRKDLHINYGSGALSPGDIANAAIGRAMGLIIKNIGGVRKGVEDMGVMGNPMKYSMVIAENEEESPWEPLHLEYGYKQEDSTITVSYPQTYIQHWPYASDADGILRSITDNIVRTFRYNIIMTPMHANNLFREGWSKQDIKEFITEYARISGARFSDKRSTGGDKPKIFNGRIAPRDADSIAIIQDPQFIRIIVAGGPGAFIAQAVGGGATPGKKHTQKIELPATWDKLVKKYKNIVPVYARY